MYFFQTFITFKLFDFGSTALIKLKKKTSTGKYTTIVDNKCTKQWGFVVAVGGLKW